MGLVSKLLGRRGVRLMPAETLGLFDLSCGKASDLVASDAAALGHLFRHVSVETTRPPKCTALFIYGSFSKEGTVGDCSLDLGEMIAESAAPIVVVATPHSGSRYRAIHDHSSCTPANLVLTLDRKGEGFTVFFEQLFAKMKDGTSMPVAWVELAPQGGVHEHEGLPDTIFECALGQMAFAPAH